MLQELRFHVSAVLRALEFLYGYYVPCLLVFGLNNGAKTSGAERLDKRVSLSNHCNFGWSR